MIQKSIFQHVLAYLLVLISTVGYAQDTEPKALEFVSHENQLFGFDSNELTDWKEQYEFSLLRDSSETNQPHTVYKSVIEGVADSINIQLSDSIDFSNVTFNIADSTYDLESIDKTNGLFTIVLPEMKSSYVLTVFVDEIKIGELNVTVYPMNTVKVIVVPLIKDKIDSDSLEAYLNRVYQQAGLNVSLEVQFYFKTRHFKDSLLSNPSPDKDRFTDQMTEIRNEYFEDYHDSEEKAYYVFVVDGFVNKSIEGYAIQSKAVSFVKFEIDNLYREVAKQLGFGIGSLEDSWVKNGPEKGSTANLMDLDSIVLTYEQWEAIQLLHKNVSYYDDYEDVRTNNGLIAYYLWEEDANGNIIISSLGLKKSLKRPFKRNTYSLFLDIDNFLFIQLFDVWEYPICFLHLFSLALLAFLSVFVRKKIVKRSARIKRYRLLRWANRFLVFVVFLAGLFGLFLLINEGYYMYEVHDGELKVLSKMSTYDASKEITENRNLRRSQEKDMGSQVLIKKGGKWTLNKKKKVLYFNLKGNDKGVMKCKFSYDSDTLKLQTKDFQKTAHSHYFVFNYLDANGDILKQEAFNHIGVDITDKLKLDDPAKRILLFVNGYRPTSLGSSFEKNFDDIRKNGLEFAKTTNLIYSFDRYAYWEKWNEMNIRFQKRLNPSETYYADGHHSVSTTNHRSLINFTTLAAKYPKRCRNPKRHVCKKSEKGWSIFGLRTEVNTYELHDLEPNEDGFAERKMNGYIAGRNLYQIFNELPNMSKNDTLYIVSHSMGYAYSLGIIEKLKGKINFGGMYIIAPENPTVGDLKVKEWKEVWQYGNDFEAYRLAAPCLLDGIAPQAKVKGLTPSQRAYSPEADYKKMGFFNSHFIGHYTWIFDLNKDQPGFINQR